jgi:hypothetical protein
VNIPSGSKPNDDRISQDEQSQSSAKPETPEPLRKRIMPKLPTASGTETTDVHRTPTDELDLSLPPTKRAAEALERLRRKMATVAEEYARGEINRAQFDAIYHRYQEQRQITERLLDRDPDSDAWQSVITPGHTSFLRNQYEAKVESYAIYHLGNSQQIIRTGHVQIPESQVQPILKRLRAIGTQGKIPPAAHRTLPEKRRAVFVPGHYSLAIVIFSREPAPAQVKLVQDIHGDFERANTPSLVRDTFDRRGMVFPHRGLFEL